MYFLVLLMSVNPDVKETFFFSFNSVWVYNLTVPPSSVVFIDEADKS